jgi:hypothetical protein
MAESVRDDPQMNQNLTVTGVRRKAAKRTFPWDLPADEVQLTLPRTQDEVRDDFIRETNRPRLEELLPTLIDEAPTENTTQDTTVALPSPDAAAADSDATHPVTDAHPNVSTTWAPLPRCYPTDPVTDTHPNVTTSPPRRNWTPVEDEQLTRAITNTPKKEHLGELTSDWVTITAQVPGRTKKSCQSRWWKTLDPNIDTVTARSENWIEDEDKKLKDAVREHGIKSWKKVAARVPGRTTKECKNRWCETLKPKIDPAPARSGKWTVDEDTKLKDAVQVHGAKKWEEIAALIPGRTGGQCCGMWRKRLDPNRSRVIRDRRRHS